ncbi:hypothetical protein C4D60_Mb00t11190 [Musa balbisiana]|uniref:Uncharacterized protein n=1 Tax=Musa balbisiana TaxID=52838 RepID=A0A4S8I311_MUSBA|nr:hypothetical protein C4D60_Mb00t11190 [Musa balbisiana]
MLAQSEGNYAEALQNYYEATRPEIDPYDRSYILYNIGLIHTSNGEHTKALEYYFRALERNPFLPQAFNNMAVNPNKKGQFEQKNENGLLIMPRSRINANFIDKTSSIVANILLRIIPTTSGEKKAFTYYRDGAI